MYRVAIIPARGGSSCIPRKNIKEFCGKPMIAWSIEAAVTSGCFEDVIVSSDNEVIAKPALECGASLPFIRPSTLSVDYTGTGAVVAHALRLLNKHVGVVDYACCVYTTAPFDSADDLQRAWKAIQRGECSYAFSVASYAYPIQRDLKIKRNGRIAMFDSSYFQVC